MDKAFSEEPVDCDKVFASSYKNFSEYAQDYYDCIKYDLSYGLCRPRREKFDSFIDKLHNCEFLTRIPKYAWEKNLKSILQWTKKYYVSEKFSKQHYKQRPINAIQEHIKILSETKKLLEGFIPEETTRIKFSKKTTIINYEGEPLSNLFSIEEAYSLMNKMILDLEKKHFNIFPKEYYYGSQTDTKANLERLLQEIARENNISPFSDDIRTFLSQI